MVGHALWKPWGKVGTDASTDCGVESFVLRGRGGREGTSEQFPLAITDAEVLEEWGAGGAHWLSKA